MRILLNKPYVIHRSMSQAVETMKRNASGARYGSALRRCRRDAPCRSPLVSLQKTAAVHDGSIRTGAGVKGLSPACATLRRTEESNDSMPAFAVGGIGDRRKRAMAQLSGGRHSPTVRR